MIGPIEATISEVTRRNIAHSLIDARYPWSGCLKESEFLSRLYPLGEMESNDHRHHNAYDDIYQHRDWNDDWANDWVFTDSRFDLLHAPDESFLRFICEMLHPIVQPDAKKVSWLLETLNGHLIADGWEIAPRSEISGRPVFAPRRRIEGASSALTQAQHIAKAFGADASYVSQQITRMETAVARDPELAIGTAKEFVETICKTVLAECAVSLKGNEDLPQLVKITLKQLKLTPDDVPEATQASQTIRILLSNLSTVAHKLAELRNLHGSGHGKHAGAKPLDVSHARLAVNAATAFGVFIFDTYRAGNTGF